MGNNSVSPIEEPKNENSQCGEVIGGFRWEKDDTIERTNEAKQKNKTPVKREMEE